MSVQRFRSDYKEPAYKHDYDIVYGPIANDKVENRSLCSQCITRERFLEKFKHIHDITFQYAFGTETAISKKDMNTQRRIEFLKFKLTEELIVILAEKTKAD